MGQKHIQEYPNIAVAPEEVGQMLDFEVLFGRQSPVDMEVGSGKGTFLISQAKAFPEINFLGVEWANKYYRYAVDRAGRWGIGNIRILRADAASLIQNHIPSESIRMFHLYFPDPWPKKRHHKRRFFCDENLGHLLGILQPGGIINIATDHLDYFEQMTAVAGRAVEQGLVEPIDFIRPACAQDGEVVGTNYERKYLKEGRKTYTLALRKR